MEKNEILTQEISHALNGSIQDDIVTIRHGKSSALLTVQGQSSPEGPTVEYITNTKDGTFSLPDLLVCPLILTEQGEARPYAVEFRENIVYNTAVVFPGNDRLSKRYTEESELKAEVKATNILSDTLQICAGCALKVLCDPFAHSAQSQKLGIESSKASLTPAIVSQLPSDIPLFNP